MKEYFVYILASQKNGTLYTGVTNDLARRVYEHKKHTSNESFTSKYSVCKLVYFEQYDDIYTAIQREKNMKHYVRKWKIDLIEKENPQWRDLYDEIF